MGLRAAIFDLSAVKLQTVVWSCRMVAVIDHSNERHWRRVRYG